MNHSIPSLDDSVVDVRSDPSPSPVVVICEHASAHIPTDLGNLGLAATDLKSHAVWDPGALGLAVALAGRLNATLIASKVSRLVYDCNRPPEAPDAILSRSELVDVPGNAELNEMQRTERVARYYQPFHRAVADVVARKDKPVLVTVHSFTPVYHGRHRDVEIGVLHDTDERLADALLCELSDLSQFQVRRNEPYGSDDGVTHTIKTHALPGGHLNVMLEVRNDLIPDGPAQENMADALAPWLTHALAQLGARA